jgi:hypothetical protein
MSEYKNLDNFDYNSKLNELKEEFDKNYNDNGHLSITIEDAKNFKFISVLGQGAFGVVVSEKYFM